MLDLLVVVATAHQSVAHSLQSQVLWNDMADSACLTTWFVYMVMPGSRRQRIAVTAAGAALEVLLTASRGARAPLEAVLSLGPGLAVAAVLGFVWRLARATPEERRAVLDYFAFALCMPLFYLVGTFNLFSHFPAPVYDLYAYALDGGGMAPSFLFAWLVEHNPVVHVVIWTIYLQLPLLMVIARHYSRQNRAAAYTDPMIVFFVLGVAGCQIYQICPMVGMRVLVGHSYPDIAPPVMVGPPHPVPAPGGFPRNCMPSLHLSWTLAACWAICRVSPRSRAVGLGLLLLTVVAARAVGDHYWVDFVAAFPFTVAVQGLCARASTHNRSERHVALVAGSSLTALVLIGLLEFPLVLMRHPVLTDLTAFGIVAASMWMEHALAAASLEGSCGRAAKAGMECPESSQTPTHD
ncbi:MAG: phosphatase PAP2 family protein [Candidatus Xenobia bacterium]